jgi:hypothetical protein
MSTVRQVKRLYNPMLELEGVLLTMYDGRMNLTQQVVARRHPADLDWTPQMLLETVDHLQGHVRLARADRRFKQDGSMPSLRERGKGLLDCLLLVGSLFVTRHLTRPPARS